MQVQIRVHGAVGPTIAAAFEDLDVRTETVISGPVMDDAAVHGLLGRLQGFGLSVMDVQVRPAPPVQPSSRRSRVGVEEASRSRRAGRCPCMDNAPTVTPVEVERARIDAESGVDRSTLHPRDGRGLVAMGIVTIALALLAVAVVGPVGPLLLPILVAVIGGSLIGAAVVVRRGAMARAEFADLRRHARRERPVRRRRRR